MKAIDIVQHLISILPRYTNLFSDTLNITSLNLSGLVVTAVNSSVHGLVNGQVVYITEAITPIGISSLTRIGDTAIAVTSSDHDLTEKYNTTVNVSGAIQTAYNGTHALISVPNRRTFHYAVSGSPITPATGTINLLENLKVGYNGMHEVAIVNTTTFTYPVEKSYGSPAQGSPKLHKMVRISNAISLDRIEESYTKQAANKLWAFVVLGAHKVSTINYMQNASGFRQTANQAFSIYIISPTTASISGSPERDDLEDVVRYFNKCLLGNYFASGYSEITHNGIITTGHDIVKYVHDYYIHQINYEILYHITSSDVVDYDTSVAFRDLRMKFVNQNEEFIINTNVNLDDVPLT